MVVIMNPNNGPDGTDADDIVYNSCIDYLRSAGAAVIGYVHTKTGYPDISGFRAIADVKADVDMWKSTFTVDGIFVDEMSNLWPEVTYDST
jgi:hypothetical protein